MAAPHVAGAAALLAAHDRAASPDSIQARLTSTGTLDDEWPDDPDRTKEPLLSLVAPPPPAA
jgi:subtilisin family serine protease